MVKMWAAPLDGRAADDDPRLARQAQELLRCMNVVVARHRHPHPACRISAPTTPHPPPRLPAGVAAQRFRVPDAARLLRMPPSWRCCPIDAPGAAGRGLLRHAWDDLLVLPGSQPGWLEGLKRRVKGLPWMARCLWESMTCLSKKTLSTCTRQSPRSKVAVGRPGSGGIAAPLVRRGDGDAVEQNPCKLFGVTDPSDRLRRGVGDQNKLCVFPCRDVSEPDNFVFHLYIAHALRGGSPSPGACHDNTAA